MLSIDRLKTVNTIVTHEHCSDGTASAMFLVDALTALNGSKPEVIFLQYNTPAFDALEARPGMLFCDFAPQYDAKRIQEFRDVGTIVLDHHKYQKNIVELFGEDGVFGDETLNPGVSGAVLAYREVWLPIKQHVGELVIQQKYPNRIINSLDSYKAEILEGLQYEEQQRAAKFAGLIGIRDTWQRGDERWFEACETSEVVRFYPPEEWMTDKPFDSTKENWWKHRKEVGQLLIRKTQDKVKRAIGSALQFTVAGVRVTVLSGGGGVTSDAAEALDQDTDLLVGFHYPGIENGVAKIVFSTRSHTDFDCGKFCKSLGGGGHTKAAGFSVGFDPFGDTPNPYTMIRALLERHLHGETC